MRLITLLLPFVLVACAHTTKPRKVVKNNLIRGSVITFEKRFALKNTFRAKGKSTPLVKTSGVKTKTAPGRSIASTCELVKFCKLNAMNLHKTKEFEVYGDYSVLTTGKYDSPSTKSWTLVNASGNELQLICGVQPKSKESHCKKTVSKIQVKDFAPFIEKLLDVKVVAAK